MSQYDFGTINPNEKSGSQLALDLNGFRDAVNSGHKGAERPTYAHAGMQWIREVSTERWDLMLFNGGEDTVLRSINPETSELIKLLTSDVDGLDDLLALTVRKDAAGSTGAAILPGGSPAQRPSTPVNGMIRYNSTTGQFEGYRGGAWGPISSEPATAADLWAFQPIGVPIPVFTHLAGVVEPPKDKSYRYVKLTAADAYNTGILTSESVVGSAPLVQANAVISLAGSPINGLTISLINTERRSLRAGNSGALENDQFQGFLIGDGSNLLSRLTSITYSAGGTATAHIGGASPLTRMNDGANGAPRAGDETRAKNIGATYYMRIK
ncbi:hypothetical protein [Pseudomonas sp.]|uniref:hypothetical protein n=1 Tax=Pseudomonas sp. TaxID=306 RepID=UPI001B0D89AD|nr:hypothetical protein [Pseudomonas sp.]MBO9552239.1 hypothetical protein [Pseudomonas sp.]